MHVWLNKHKEATLAIILYKHSVVNRGVDFFWPMAGSSHADVSFEQRKASFGSQSIP